MEMSVQEFLNSISNPRTRKCYNFGLNKFVGWYGKSAEDVLSMRQADLTQKQGENIIDYRNRAARFQREIEKFHSNLLKDYSLNSARNMTLGIRQLFRYYQMPVIMRTGSKVSQTFQTSKNFPLTIEHVRKLFNVANLKERTILSLAVDLGLRISDFLSIKKTDLPSLDGQSPLAFDLLTQKEKITAHCFLSQESVNNEENIYLFPSNGKSHVSDEAVGKMLKKLVAKAQINPNGKSLTFHCFRKMFLSASIDSGIGLTAGKLMCGKAVAKSDSTYLTTDKLRDKFIQLKRFLSINEQTQIETDKIESFEKTINHLQEELTTQKIINETVTKKNLELESRIEELTSGQAGLEKEVDEIRTTLFGNSFRELVKSSIETINEIEKKAKAKKKEGSEES